MPHNGAVFFEAQHRAFLQGGDMAARYLRHAFYFVACLVMAVPVCAQTPQDLRQRHFFPSYDMGSSSSTQANAGAPAKAGEYIYATPPGWTTTNYPDGIVLMSPASATNEKCVVTVSPMRPSGGANLLAEADSVFRDVYKAYELRAMTNRGTQMPASIVHGISGQGWEYVIIRRGIAPRGSPESRLGFVFVARLSNRLAVISGVSKDPLVSTCMGELSKGNAWPRFFY